MKMEKAARGKDACSLSVCLFAWDGSWGWLDFSLGHIKRPRYTDIIWFMNYSK